jgi:putative molybdopterin biosynthesis protein
MKLKKSIGVSTMEEKKVYTPKEVMEILRLSKNAVYQAIKTGEIYSVHIGDRYLIPSREIEKMLNGDKKPVNAS